MPKDDVKLNLRIPPALHRKMKTRAAKERRSLNDEILLAIEAWLRKR